MITKRIYLKIVFCFLFVFSIFVGNQIFADIDNAEEELLEEQKETYRSRSDDEEAYYKAIKPPDIDEGEDFYRKDHPLEEKPLEEKLIR